MSITPLSPNRDHLLSLATFVGEYSREPPLLWSLSLESYSAHHRSSSPNRLLPDFHQGWPQVKSQSHHPYR
jgi:hypothetical protein